jgi:uncharacterized protein YggU (UPF0235/DUF167 family)
MASAPRREGGADNNCDADSIDLSARWRKALSPFIQSSSGSRSMSQFCHWEGDVLVLNVLGRPAAKQTAIGKVIGKQLEIHVAERPVRGRATAHMVRFLAGEFDVPEEAITVVFGVYKVNKQLRIKAPKRLPAMIPPCPPQQESLFD